MQSNDIIAAVATPPGRGGIGVVRVSGKSLRALALKIIGHVPEARHAALSRFLDNNGQTIDQGIAIYFPSPNSYTGEDVLELQGHGGHAIIDLLLSRCLEAGARLAEPGEFTLRAYLNNKMDLAQAESVADVISASTSKAARSAMRSLHGEFSTAIQELVQALTNLRILIESALDFPEEETGAVTSADISAGIKAVAARLDQVADTARQGSLLREGARVVVAGQPNVGKSSVMNRLSGEEVSIVTEIPGTTRDPVRQVIELEGVPLYLVDTAGLRETGDPVEKVGIARAREAISSAEVALLVVDARVGLTPADMRILESFPAEMSVIQVYNKMDLLEEMPLDDPAESSARVYLSAKTGAGLDSLRRQLLASVGWHAHETGEGVFMARNRHLNALNAAASHISRALEQSERVVPLELAAEELRLAQQSLSCITGEFTADDLLGEIFSRFCIGK
jgi:tRNA modification GTPase